MVIHNFSERRSSRSSFSDLTTSPPRNTHKLVFRDEVSIARMIGADEDEWFNRTAIGWLQWIKLETR
jgi:hypothetical protein